MSFHAANDQKERVRDETDIVALLGSYLQLQPRGRNYVAICPFHDDSRPSLTINPERQTWKCWPCDAGGDVFSFVMRRENVDFPEALRILAERAGIELTRSAPKAPPGSPSDKATLYKAMAWAEQQFHRYFLEASEAQLARDYVAERSIDESSIERFKIGYAPNEWNWLMDRAQSTPYSPAVLEAVGLIIKNDRGRRYDRFRGRVIFPIRDTQNRAIAMGGRILPEIADQQPPENKPAKYLNSPETRLYSKSDQLYALNLGREQLAEQGKQHQVRNAIVMEGYTDVVIASQFGVACPLAVCGTALGARHLNLLRRFADRVTLVLDGDEAGQRRAAEVLELFVAAQMELRMVTLPDGLDPADFLIQRGLDAFHAIVESSPDALDFCVTKETLGIDLANETLRAVPALNRIIATMAKAPRPREDTPAVFRLREQQTLSRLARMFRVEESTLRESLQEEREKTPSNVPADAPTPSQATKKSQLHGWERELFMLLIRSPEAISAVIEKIAPDEMRTDLGRSFLELYQQLEVEGRQPDFGCVMGAFHSEDHKNIFAGLAEEADRLQWHALDSHVNQMLATFESRRQEQSRRRHIAELETGNLKAEEELELLNKLFDSKKLEL